MDTLAWEGEERDGEGGWGIGKQGGNRGPGGAQALRRSRRRAGPGRPEWAPACSSPSPRPKPGSSPATSPMPTGCSPEPSAAGEAAAAAARRRRRGWQGGGRS